MDDKEKAVIKLRYALAFKKILDRNKEIAQKNKLEGKKDADLISTNYRLEKWSGIPKATLIGLLQGRINAASTTIAAILDAFGMSFSEFGLFYDSITEKEIALYKESLTKPKTDQQRGKTK
ncbi:MAG: hypothetical protein E6Q36_00100 [Chryseobacterium sp.]|nr:MAG: hypothetical protein E6Q36_00100 [Chryseobacterium sp.]